MWSFLARLLLVAVPVGLALVPAEAADAWDGPCIAGKKRPICHFSKGKVTFVADGDTLDVNVFGDGTARPIRVRITGIDAMEQSVYSKYPSRRRGACHALAATARLERLVKLSRRVVRLGSQARDPMAGRRHRRSVAVRLSGRWRDAGQMLIDEGHVLWLPNRGEWARNTPYNFGAQKSGAARLRLWDTDSCRSGPQQSTPLRMWVNWDADGRDGRGNLNGEWVKLKNLGGTDLPISRWWFRDSWLKRFTFPSGAVVPAGGTITLFVGSRPSRDRNRSTHFYWGRSAAMFENVNLARGVGDGGYLFDPQGDLRLWMTYPCRHRCGDPLRGKVRLTARRSAPEEVQVRNASSDPVNLEGYVIESHPWIYSFPAATVVNPGETMRLVVIGSRANDTRLVKYWGKSRFILNDGGDRVLLRTQRNVRIACYSWGSASC
jgi:endonuclease YncB( thermonuclease family)